jgi:geranylgeranyl pyrophosphate synthase
MVGTPTALNAGHWLYFWPMRLISTMDLPPRIELAVLRRAGETLLRCHEGQALDLSVRVCQLSQRDVGRVVEATTRLKTGSLMEFAAALGAEAAGASAELLSAICCFGRELGVGLQMLDDLGSLLSDRRADKALEDLTQGRPTWPWAWLASEVDEVTFAALQHQARMVTSGPSALALRDAMRKSLAGQGRLRVRSHLSRSISELRDAIGDRPALQSIEDEIGRLEQSYG